MKTEPNITAPTLEQFREQVTNAARSPLLARIAELEQACRYEADLCEQALDSRRHAEARIAELEKDAARYRWLRAQMHFTKSHDKQAFMWVEIDASETHDFDFEFMSPHFEASVDRTIDAAMAKEAP